MTEAFPHHDLRSSIRHGDASDTAPAVLLVNGIEILGVAGVLKGRKATSIPKCRFDIEVCAGVYVDEPVVRCGNLVCARGKKDISPWMRTFVPMIEEFIAS